MKALRVLLSGWTASFRHPDLISGYQPTLPCPPLSTVYGILSAAKGDVVTPEDVSVAYVFTSESKSVDLETIYELSPGLTAKSNVVRREFLFNPRLWLYITDLSYEDCFKAPYYPLLMGRSSDLTSVDRVETVDLIEKEGASLGKTLLPFGLKGAHGLVKALPTHFTNTIPRKAVGTKAYILMDTFFKCSDKCLYDPEMEWAVWLYGKR
jgi:CRISPR-associated protein Cas5t